MNFLADEIFSLWTFQPMGFSADEIFSLWIFQPMNFSAHPRGFIIGFDMA